MTFKKGLRRLHEQVMHRLSSMLEVSALVPHQKTVIRTLSTASKLVALGTAAPAAMLMAPESYATHTGPPAA